MGWRGINLSSLILLVTLVILLFGTKRLRHAGQDIATAIRDFRRTINQEDKPPHA